MRVAVRVTYCEETFTRATQYVRRLSGKKPYKMCVSHKSRRCIPLFIHLLLALLFRIVALHRADDKSLYGQTIPCLLKHLCVY